MTDVQKWRFSNALRIFSFFTAIASTGSFVDPVGEYPGGVCAGKDDQVLGVGGELHLLHLGVYTGAEHLLPRAGVPQLDCVVLTGRRHPLTAWRKHHLDHLKG